MCGVRARARAREGRALLLEERDAKEDREFLSLFNLGQGSRGGDARRRRRRRPRRRRCMYHVAGVFFLLAKNQEADDERAATYRPSLARAHTTRRGCLGETRRDDATRRDATHRIAGGSRIPRVYFRITPSNRESGRSPVDESTKRHVSAHAVRGADVWVVVSCLTRAHVRTHARTHVHTHARTHTGERTPEGSHLFPGSHYSPGRLFRECKNAALSE